MSIDSFMALRYDVIDFASGVSLVLRYNVFDFASGILLWYGTRGVLNGTTCAILNMYSPVRCFLLLFCRWSTFILYDPEVAFVHAGCLLDEHVCVFAQSISSLMYARIVTVTLLGFPSPIGPIPWELQQLSMPEQLLVALTYLHFSLTNPFPKKMGYRLRIATKWPARRYCSFDHDIHAISSMIKVISSPSHLLCLATILFLRSCPPTGGQLQSRIRSLAVPSIAKIWPLALLDHLLHRDRMSSILTAGVLSFSSPSPSPNASPTLAEHHVRR